MVLFIATWYQYIFKFRFQHVAGVDGTAVSAHQLLLTWDLWSSEAAYISNTKKSFLVFLNLIAYLFFAIRDGEYHFYNFKNLCPTHFEFNTKCNVVENLIVFSKKTEFVNNVNLFWFQLHYLIYQINTYTAEKTSERFLHCQK